MNDDLEAFQRALTYFATDVGLAVSLEQGNRITAEEAYRRIRRRWKALREMHRELQGINPEGLDGR